MGNINLKNVSKSFGDLEVIPPLDLKINAGEFVVFVGPSGCGKSTLLRLIAGLESLTSGEIIIADRPVMDLPPSERGIAMVFQSYALYPHMNIHENLSFGLKRMKGEEKLSDDEIKSRVEEMATMLGLGEELSKRPKELSGGQRQRVALGRALIKRPKVLLMDEPLSNLDAELRHQMRGEIRRLHEELGCTTIYVTHDQIEAMTLADRIAILDKGELQQHCPPMEAYNNPANDFVKGFLVKHLNDIKETADTLFKD